MLHNTTNNDHGEERRCAVCGIEGNTAHDPVWSETINAWVHSYPFVGDYSLCESTSMMSRKELITLLRSLFWAATHEGNKQYVRDGAEAAFLNAAKDAHRRREKRQKRKAASE